MRHEVCQPLIHFRVAYMRAAGSRRLLRKRTISELRMSPDTQLGIPFPALNRLAVSFLRGTADSRWSSTRNLTPAEFGTTNTSLTF
jgi:hypothetical protein